VRRDLPAGTVTFLFTDVEGSTRLLRELGAEAYAEALAKQRRVLREAFGAHGGVEVDTQGDAFFVAFPTAPGAAAAAEEARRKLTGPIRVRAGIHTGTPLLTDEGYVGADVHRAARIAACGHGGQVLVSAAAAALFPSNSLLLDLGLHRLKDLSAPERIYQLGDGEFPPLKSLHQTNLPIPATPFLGREKELGEVLGLLSRDDVRLLTLTGPGGTGKTRLGAQAAAALAERYPHGVWWIPLASLRDPALVVETAAQTLGARDGLADHIGDKSMLLLFDNFEHLVEAAGDVAMVLDSCPKLEVLVTSREPLHVSGEQEYAVPPFAHEEGVGFFLARARAVDPRFEPDAAVSEICRRLDDLPLALELAAARVKALTTQKILERLQQRLPLLTGGARDLPERQRTLRAAIAWSYDLLMPEEQRLFARLAVFRGGCTLEAAEAVAAAELDTLQSLVDKSLIRRADDRYWMLETIREYAAARLEESDETRHLDRRHAQFFLALAEEAEPNLPAYRREWINRLDAEHDNIRAALDWFEASGETQNVLRLAGAVMWFWYVRGHFREGLARIETALSRDDRRTRARAKALTAASFLGGELQRRCAEEALALERELGDSRGIAQAQLALGAAIANDDMARARELWEASSARFHEAGDEHYALIADRLLALAYINLGEHNRGIALREDVLHRAQALPNERVEGMVLGAIATSHLHAGRFDEAVALLKDSHRVHAESGDPFQSALDICRFAYAVAVKGDAATAAKILSTSDELVGALGWTLREWDPAFVDDLTKLIRDLLDDESFADAWKDGRTLSADEAVALALEALSEN
jgi:predicted ATPase/class 3 adenylate cyclase